ncbi:zinc-binding alcohol dehydrogenase family protein [Pseudolysinimonas sp.]|uniref:zinc-binding alcohol dehydrogenase family protein n=1 Tax=Pseudolysinimonas sp. TaxID=2680009 RepID=UPI003F7EA3FB
MTSTMRAWRSGAAGLTLQEVARPRPRRDELLVRPEVCGICRTDLHVVDGELARRRRSVTPGHQVVGRVVAAGRGAAVALGARVGVAWLHRTCGACAYCRSGRENLCEAARFTGWDADGGFAELLTVPAAFAYPLPEDADTERLAPLLCAGIIGYRALRRARLEPGGTLGLYGFGSSAHLTAMIARAAGADVIALTRGEENRALARRMGIPVVGEADDPPRPLDAAIVFAPAGFLVPAALRATRPGGTVVLAGIHMTPIPELDYDGLLFRERDLRSVTANTRADGDAFIRLALRLDLGAATTAYPFDALPAALDDLRTGRRAGSLVLRGVA